MTQQTSAGNLHGAETLLVALAKKFCIDPDDVVEPERTPARDAQIVFDHMQALEREAMIRMLQSDYERIEDVVHELTDMAEKRMWKQASALCTTFGMGTAQQQVLVLRAYALRFSMMAQAVAPGAIDAAAIDAFCKLADEMSKDILKILMVERGKATGRKPDGWRRDLLEGL